MKTIIVAGVVLAAISATSPAPAQQAQAAPMAEASAVTPASFPVPLNLKATEGLKPEIRFKTELVLADPENNGQVTLESGRRTVEQQQHQIDCHAKGEPGCMPADPIDKSTHVKGEAVDLSGPKELRLKLAKRYGLYNPYKTADEAQHFELDPNKKAGEK